MKNRLYILIAAFLLACTCGVQGQIITTVAGGDSVGLGDGGPAVDCELKFPYATAIDAAGNLYIADQGNNRVRKVNTAGIITTIAGTGIAGYSGDDSAATAAKIDGPSGVAVDASGNVYFSDNYNQCVRKINTAGIITTVAGNASGYGYNGDGIPGTSATLYSPHGIAVDLSGNLYICDVLNNRLRKISAAGIITTIAGTGFAGGYGGDGGAATATDIGEPYGVAIDATGNVYFAGLSYNRVFKISTSGIISTIAGTGRYSYNGDNIAATSADLRWPFDVAVDKNDNVFIADLYNYRIRYVNTAGIINTIAGTGTPGFSGDGGTAIAAEIEGVTGISLDGTGNLYIADDGNFRIRYVRNTLAVTNQQNTYENFIVYPNPCNGSFVINITSHSNEQANLLITNIQGQRVKETTINTNEPVEMQLDAPAGVYFLSATTAHERWTQKIIINKCC